MAQQAYIENEQGMTEVVMPVDLLHTFPLTHGQAVDILLDAPWTPQEQKWIEMRSLVTLFHPVGDNLRKHWWMDDKSFPLPRHYMKQYNLGDPGDMVALIILDWLARLREEQFSMSAYVNEFRRQKLSQGIDPLTLEKIPRTT